MMKKIPSIVRSLMQRSQSNPRRTFRPRLETLETRQVLAVAFVTTEADAGAGSFRDAVEQANGNPAIDTIIFKNDVSTVSLATAVEYSGSQALKVEGHGAVILGDQSFDLFISSGDADLELKKLTFRGGQKGIYVPISGAASGTVSVQLSDVTIQDNLSHGLHIDDQTIGSPASVALRVNHSLVEGNGTGAIDQDGIRVDEGGEGDIDAVVSHTTVSGNGGDGLELDERGMGSARLETLHSAFLGNGFLVAADLDDGVDIDEADDGDLWMKAVHSTFSGNFEEGLDVNETGNGDLIVDLLHVEANGNGEEGIDVEESEDDDLSYPGVTDGDVIVTMSNVVANDNGNEGIDLNEYFDGELVARLSRVVTKGNGGDGVEVSEVGVGDLTLFLFELETTANSSRGIDVDESNAGVLFIQLKKVNSSGNGVADDVT